MPTWTGTFELRVSQMEWTPAGAGVAEEDVRICTFHNIKLTGGNPDAAWTQANYDSLHQWMQSFWVAIRGYYAEELVFTEVRTYKAGPQITPPQPPVDTSAYTDAGTS